MKIAIVYDMIYPFNIGGAEIRNYELARRLAKSHEVHLFGVKLWDGPDVIKRDGMTIHGVCRYGELYSFSGKRKVLEPIKFAVRLYRHLSSELFDVIDASSFPYFHCFICKLISIRSRTPLVLTWHQYWADYWYSYLGPVKGFIGKRIERLVLRLTKNNLAVSQTTKKDLVAAGLKPDNVFVNYNGVDLQKIAAATPSGEKYDVVFVGRLVHQKNVELLIRAVALIKEKTPGVRACIIGGGPDREKLAKLSKELHVEKNVAFTGFLKDPSEVYSIMKSSLVFVLPSLLEGFGIVVVEANACGLPVIVVRTKWNASVELVGDNGMAVENTPEDMASAIRTLLSDEAQRKKMSEKALEKARDFDWDNITRSLENYYKGVVKWKQG